MLELLLAYAFAAALTVIVVYLAWQNRRQGWRRPAPRWFGVTLDPDDAPPPERFDTPSDGLDAVLPQVLRLNRELAAHGTSVRPELKPAEAAEVASTPRV